MFNVAPFTGAWIEIIRVGERPFINMSHPSRVRGLKFCKKLHGKSCDRVAPFTGAWIEINSV